MTPRLADSRNRIVDLLPPSELDGVDATYDHEVPGEATGNVYVTVAFERLTPTEQVFAVRVYSKMADSPEAAAERLEVAVESVDDALGVANLGPSDWQAGLSDELGALVARCFVNVGRETF